MLRVFVQKYRDLKIREADFLKLQAVYSAVVSIYKRITLYIDCSTSVHHNMHSMLYTTFLFRTTCALQLHVSDCKLS